MHARVCPRCKKENPSHARFCGACGQEIDSPPRALPDAPGKPVSRPDGVSRQLPSSIVAEEFGEVNVKPSGAGVQVEFTILMEPTGSGAEGWQTGVAIDASGSMQSVFGKGLLPGPSGGPPDHLLASYLERGWLELFEYEGEVLPILSDEAKEDLVRRGHSRWSTNEVDPLAKRMTAYLASNLDADGGTTVIYWACGDGSQIEVIGDLSAEECEGASFVGPKTIGFGEGTILLPAVRYFAERFQEATNGMYIFITDGELGDLEEVKRYTVHLCREIEAGRRNHLKCVLIGVGEDVNEAQMAELDDLDSGTNVDIWDHKIAREMRTLLEVFAEVVSENQVVAPRARILDASGTVIKHFTDGLPARVAFVLPASSPFFELEVAGRRIRQVVHA